MRVRVPLEESGAGEVQVGSCTKSEHGVHCVERGSVLDWLLGVIWLLWWPGFCGERASVVSGLAPRWAAQRPQNKRERCALQRGASPLTTKASQLDSLNRISGTSIALSIHLPGYRSIGYPPTQSRPHKKVRTRPIGTHRHGLIKNAFFETAVPPLFPSALTRYWNGSIFL